MMKTFLISPWPVKMVKQVEAHKVILASLSPVFQNILKSNKHAHLLLYMRGMKSNDLLAILDFLYCGVAKVYQEDLDSFLVIAEELQLKGLLGKSNQKDETHTKNSDVPVAENTAFKDETKMTKSTAMPAPRGASRDSLTQTVALANEHSGNMQKLDKQINSLMTKSSRKNMHGRSIFVCNVCGKEEKDSNMKNHIEANHLEGISIPCNFCDKMFRSRHSKAVHVSLYHKGQQDLV